MKKSILSLGQELSKKEKKEITGGTGSITPINDYWWECVTTAGSPCETDADCCHNPSAKCLPSGGSGSFEFNGFKVIWPSNGKACDIA